MTPLGPEARALLDAGRSDVTLPADERARVRTSMLAAASAGAALSTGGTAAAKLTVAKATTVLFTSPFFVGATLMLASATAYYGFRERPAPAETPSPRAARVAASPATTPSTEMAQPLRDVPAPPAPPREVSAAQRSPHPVQPKSHQQTSPFPPTPAPSIPETGFAEDARLLREVHAALSSGEGEKALSMLDARRATGGSGVLAEEREAARVVTLCELGKPEAQTAAQLFLTEHATSPLSERVRRACAKASQGRPTK